MTFRAIDPAVAKIYYAEEVDRPITTLNIPDGSLVIFTDSGLEDSFDGVSNSWFNRKQIVETASGGTATLSVQTDIPAFPSQNNLEAVNVAGAADNDVLYTSSDVSGYNTRLIQNNDTIDIDVEVSMDGIIFIAPPTPLVIIGNSVGELKGKYKNIRVNQAAVGTVEAGNVIITHGVE